MFSYFVSMISLEILLYVIAFLGLVLNYLGFPIGNTALIVSLSSLSILYIYFDNELYSSAGFKESMKRFNPIRLTQKNYSWSSIVSYTLAVTLMGILFKILKWPGASAMLIAGIFSSIINTIIIILKLKKENKEYHNKVIMRLVSICLFASFLFLFS